MTEKDPHNKPSRRLRDIFNRKLGKTAHEGAGDTVQPQVQPESPVAPDSEPHKYVQGEPVKSLHTFSDSEPNEALMINKQDVRDLDSMYRRREITGQDILNMIDSHNPHKERD